MFDTQFFSHALYRHVPKSLPPQHRSQIAFKNALAIEAVLRNTLLAMRSRYTFVDSDGIYFLTSTIVEWIPVFTTGEYCEIITDSLAHCRQTRSLRVYAYVVMENHVHIVAESNNLIEVIKTFKRHTAKEIIRLATRTKRDWLLNQFEYYKKRYKRNSRYQVWQEGVHPQLIQGDQMLQQKVAYIHENPVRRGLVAEPEHWRYSSAGNYAEQPNQPMTIDELPL